MHAAQRAQAAPHVPRGGAHSSAGSGSRSTMRTWMPCVDAARQIGCRPLCTMATCWPPTTKRRCFSSWIALPPAPRAAEQHAEDGEPAVAQRVAEQVRRASFHSARCS